MSEFWVSKKKYFCKYCDIFIADDAPSRQQHENGLRHQGNKARFVRDLYKNSERKKRDLEEEKREMVHVERAAAEAYAKDLGTGAAGDSPASSSGPPAKIAAAPKRSTDKYANYSTAESLGFVDEDALRIAEEEAIRMKEGRIGEWTTVVPTPTAAAAESGVDSLLPPADPEETRGWRLDGVSTSRRRVAVGLGEIYDPGVIKIKKREDEVPVPAEIKAEIEDDATTAATSGPKWTPRGWRKASDAPANPVTPVEGPRAAVAKDEAEESVATETMAPEKDVSLTMVKEGLVEPTLPAPASSGMFRKRKAGATGASRGSRR